MKISSNNNKPKLEHAVHGRSTFCHLVNLERKRSDRSGNPFLLVLVELGESRQGVELDAVSVDKVLSGLSSCFRETDVLGWYETGRIVGGLLTELGESVDSSTEAASARVWESLKSCLPAAVVNELSVRVFRYPEDREGVEVPQPNVVFFPDPTQEAVPRRVSRAVKRAIDIGVCLALVVLLAPAFVLVALVQKFTSPGPILWAQARVGLHGKRFTMLKFRSMYTNSDDATHEAYAASFIEAGRASESELENLKQEGLFKLMNDPRVTPLGRWLRQTSVDELPQIFNVLKGDMSLVGPRPPIPYELSRYQDWHLRRIMEVKPGITGLWQVTGRSRTTFDEMVRLDLRYSTGWSVWQDLLLLARTPMAVLRGDGAA